MEGAQDRLAGQRAEHTAGRHQDRSAGRDEGRSVGRDEGRSVGRDEGRSVGRDEGRSVGRTGYRLAEPEADLELLVHGVGGTTPEKMLGDPRTVRVTGDDTAAVFRRADDVETDPLGGGPGGDPGDDPREHRGRDFRGAPGWALGVEAGRDPAGDPGRGRGEEPGRGSGGAPGGDPGGEAGRDPAGDPGRGREGPAGRGREGEHGRGRGRGPVREAYVWCNLTSGDAGRALWLLLLPFMVVNLAHWMRPAAPGRPRAVRLYGLLVRLAALTLTVLLVAAACEVALDLVAWQCAGTHACARRHSWLGFLTPATPAASAGSGGWWSAPGRRLALAAALPAALTGLLWYLSHRTWNAYESHRPLALAPAPHTDDSALFTDDSALVTADSDPGTDVPAQVGEPAAPDTVGSVPVTGAAPDPVAPDPVAPGPDDHGSALALPGFWYGRRLVARLRAAHTAAGLLTVAAAVTTPAIRFDHRPGGPAALDTLGRLLAAALLVGGAMVVGVVCRRGRSEDRLDRRLDRHLVRALPPAALALLVLGLVYAG